MFFPWCFVELEGISHLWLWSESCLGAFFMLFELSCLQAKIHAIKCFINKQIGLAMSSVAKKQLCVFFLRCGSGLPSSLIQLVGLVESPGSEGGNLPRTLDLAYPSWNSVNPAVLAVGFAVITLCRKGKYRRYSGFLLNRRFHCFFR